MKKIFLVFIFSFIFIGLIIRNYKLKALPYLDWDEGMYAQISREMIKNKSLITTFNNNLWFDKPPLSHLIIAFSFLALGESEFNSRLMMVFLSIILLYLLIKLNLKLIKNKKNSFLLVIIPALILSGSNIFLERSTMLNSDLLVAISWIGYLLYYENWQKKTFFILIGALSKSVLGFYPLLYDLLIFILKIKKINLKQIIQILTTIAIASVWYFYSFLKFGYFFIENHFFSQMFKRIYVPIELHFGNKFFYLSYLWQDLKIIILIIGLSYTIFFLDLIKKKNESLKKLLPIYLLPLPFIAFLTIMKTKISWYVIIFLPLLILPSTYLYLQIKNNFLKLLVNFLIIGFFTLKFIPQTYLLKPNFETNEKIILAQCLSKKINSKISVFVDEQERKNRNFLEAAHYQTTSSFFYGGSPSFVYYLNKPVEFYYQKDELEKKLDKIKYLVINQHDLKEFHLKNKIPICQTKSWLALKIND